MKRLLLLARTQAVKHEGALRCARSALEEQTSELSIPLHHQVRYANSQKP